MKTLFVILAVSLFSFSSNQDKSVNKWVQQIVDDMVAMEDLGKYSKTEIPPDVTVNFVMVESVRDITIEGGIIRMLVNHGKGTYCTELKFKYSEDNGKFFLIFATPEVKSVLDKEQKFINPWIEKNKICN